MRVQGRRTTGEVYRERYRGVSREVQRHVTVEEYVRMCTGECNQVPVST